MEAKSQKICFPVTDYQKFSDKRWEAKIKLNTDNSYGEIWQACLSDECKYILKYQSYGVPDSRKEYGYEPVTKETIENEIKMQKRFAKLDLAPEVTDSWFCDYGGVIVMPALKYTVRDILKKYEKDTKVKYNVLSNSLKLISDVHSNNLAHGDPHLNNIMVDIQPEYEDNKKAYKYYTYYFIDMGRSNTLTKESKRRLIKEDYIVFASDLHNLIDNEKGQKDLKYIEDMISSFIKDLPDA